MKYCKACFRPLRLWGRFLIWLEEDREDGLCRLCNWDYTKYKGSKEDKNRRELFKKWLKKPR